MQERPTEGAMGAAVLDPDSDAALKLGSRDHDAFNLLYRRHSKAVHRYLAVALRDRDLADDVAQEAFMKAFMCGAQYEARGDRFEAWLFRIVRNCALDYLDRDRRIDLENPFEIDRRLDRRQVSPERPLTRWDKLAPLINRLPLAQQQVLGLRYLYGLPTAEIAQVLDRSADAVRQLETRAMRFLRLRALRDALA